MDVRYEILHTEEFERWDEYVWITFRIDTVAVYALSGEKIEEFYDYYRLSGSGDWERVSPSVIPCCVAQPVR